MTDSEVEPDITVLVTGITGSGKSAACNFFLQQKAFLSKHSFKPVTKSTQSKDETIGGKIVRLIDTPGFLDPSSATGEDELEELARAILGVPNGINALGLVININERINDPIAKTLTHLLQFVELIPYAFVIFSHAKELADTDDEQKKVAEEMLTDDSVADPILSKVLHDVNYRYIVLESVKDMKQGYHEIKIKELFQIVQAISEASRKPFTCFMTDVAKKLQESKINLEECIKAVKTDLKKLQEQLKIEKQKESQLVKSHEQITARSFWEKWSIWIATGTGATLGTTAGAFLGPGGSAAGATLGASYLAGLVGSGAAVGGVAGGGLGVAATKLCIIQ